MISYEALRAEVARRKQQLWLAILAGEGPRRAPGRRPRETAKEDLLVELDRARVEALEEERGMRLHREGRAMTPSAPDSSRSPTE